MLDRIEHEINTPLQTILSTLEVLADTDESERSTLATSACAEVVRIRRVLRQLRTDQATALPETAPTTEGRAA